MCDQAISQHLQLSISQAHQLPPRIHHILCSSFGPVPQPVLVNPRYPGNAACKTNADRVAVALGLEISGGAQLFEHRRSALDAALFGAQLALLARYVGCAVGVLLAGDALLLASAQLLGEGPSQSVAGVGLQLAEQRRCPVFQSIQVVSHESDTRCLALGRSRCIAVLADG